MLRINTLEHLKSSALLFIYSETSPVVTGPLYPYRFLIGLRIYPAFKQQILQNVFAKYKVEFYYMKPLHTLNEILKSIIFIENMKVQTVPDIRFILPNTGYPVSMPAKP